jgi:hypothetical protein
VLPAILQTDHEELTDTQSRLKSTGTEPVPEKERLEPEREPELEMEMETEPAHIAAQ